jgi:hypothetical protein
MESDRCAKPKTKSPGIRSLHKNQGWGSSHVPEIVLTTFG